MALNKVCGVFMNENLIKLIIQFFITLYLNSVLL